MRMTTKLKGALKASDGGLRTWTGIPIGVGVTYAATKVMPDFGTQQLQNDWLYPLPYCAPAALLGIALLFSKKTQRMGYGVLGGTAGYYLWAAVGNQVQSMITERIAPTQTEGAAVRVL